MPRFASNLRRTHRERGFSLIVSLMMLIVIIILGVSASQMAVNEERGARNDRDRQIAFQAAEAALKDAEYEILNPASPPCAAPGQIGRGHGRAGTFTCFNSINTVGFTATAGSACSLPPNQGLCDYDAASPAWRRPQTDPTHVDFVADAKGTGTMSSVEYGHFTGNKYGSQAIAGFAGKPLSRYPPRYIIELIPQNTSSVDTMTEGGPCAGLPCMFRITAMGFGVNVNSQVVLQTIVSTKD